jgi:RNA polymerase sigma factor (sigma-70 family)
MLVNPPDAPDADAAGEPSDRELLQRFQARNDEAAFAAVIRRHGPMVLRVGQRILDRREDAEDVFQATFLVLARKAATVSWRESIATWLHEAAHRLAREVRRSRVRRSVREASRPAPASGDTLAEVTSRELLTVLDEELLGLPEDLRGPLLLCCMEGMSGDEAAAQLGCSPSTVKRRLRQARELLQARLTRRGIALSVAALSVLLTLGTAAASVPAELVATSSRAAAQIGAGAALSAVPVSPGGIALARQYLHGSATLKAVAGLVVLGGLIASGVAVSLLPTNGPGRGSEVRPVEEPAGPVATEPRPVVVGVPVTVETSLRTGGGQIRQFAFDGDPATYFASADNPAAADHFTLRFDNPVSVRLVSVQTGAPDGGRKLAAGRLEVSADGATFEPLAAFKNGVARGDAGGREVVAVRVVPAAQGHPLVIREFVVAAPQLVPFRHPVEFAVDTSGAPEMAAWAERVARTCERAYPMVCDELAADGFRPPTLIPFAVRRDARGIVSVSGSRVTASAKYFEANPHDIGAVVYATALVVQGYRRPVPGWLGDGIADYVRFHKFEPGATDPPDPATARHDRSSRDTAAFLAFCVQAYNPDLVRRLNDALRRGRYADDVWVSLTGKSLSELADEWRRSLRR